MQSPARSSLFGSELEELAKSEPQKAVSRAYEEVRDALIGALDEAGVNRPMAGEDLASLAELAHGSQLIRPQTLDSLVGLNVLNNLAEHSPHHEITAERAYEYLALADASLYSVQSAFRKRSEPPTQEAA